MIEIRKLNEVYLQVRAPEDTRREISEHFSFRPEGYQFIPSYKYGHWDGWIRLYNSRNGEIYAGLASKLVEFLKEREYEYTFEVEGEEEFSLFEAREFIKTLDIPEKYGERDFQLEAFIKSVRKRRATFLSPTGSGKSMIIYIIARWLLAHGIKPLIVVPTKGLVEQLASDFKDYAIPSDISVLKIQGGVDKSLAKGSDIVISTWQSIYKQGSEFFAPFGAVLGDEAHLFTAESLVKIATTLSHAKYRFGFTGTLEETKANNLVIEGIFGEVIRVATTQDLQERGILADINVKMIILKYPEHQKLEGYADEVDFLCTNTYRNQFIANLAASLPGNTLVLFFKIEHGKELAEMIQKKTTLPVYLVYGDIPVEDREDIRKAVTGSDSSTIVASFGTFQLGINIPNIHNIIFASFWKSTIVNLQSIGRGLRVHESKQALQLFDIADDLRKKSSSKMNYSLEHAAVRMATYTKEGFPYKTYNVELKCPQIQ